MKIDRYFANGVEDDVSKREAVRSVIDMTRRMGTRVIVEGVETEVEYATLRALGMSHAQGYLLGRPGQRPSDTSPSLPGESARFTGSKTKMKPVAGDLANPAAAESPQTTVDHVLARFHADPELQCIPLVDQLRHPVGVVRRNALLSRTAQTYGHALYANRAVSEFMETPALMVPSDLSLEAVSRRITDKPNGDESFIITDEHDRYLATGSIYDLLRRITDLQIHSARHANPLTGLPGNVLIAQHIASLLAAARTFTVIHADLDDFKPYNDYYGYQRGDEVIQATLRLLQPHVREEEFVGHVGGNDFVLVLNGHDWRSRCESVLDAFAARAPRFYDAADRDRGWIETHDRRGNPQRASMLSVSLAAVPMRPRQFSGHHVISTALVEIKHCAKNQPGNSLFVDRRMQSAFVSDEHTSLEAHAADGNPRTDMDAA